jgi:hypothetical protein
MKIFHNKQKLKEFMTTKPALQKILKPLLHTEELSQPGNCRDEHSANNVCTHVCKYKNDTWWKCSKSQGRRDEESSGKGEFKYDVFDTLSEPL